MLVLLFFSVWWMGSSKTKDDFLRELLFAEITHSHYLQGIVAVLTLDAVFGVMLFRSWMSRDRRELKRCAEEKARLQELLAGRQLAHTEKLVRDDATKFS